jgi:hypothetical protein
VLFLVRLKACVPKFKARGERTASPERTLAQASFFAGSLIRQQIEQEGGAGGMDIDEVSDTTSGG